MTPLTPDWEFVADTVMGGVSQGGVSHEDVAGRMAARLTGEVSTENNGGFVQMAFDLMPDGGVFDASGHRGLVLEVQGNGKPYELRLRTADLSRPWQSFRAGFTARPDWERLEFPFAAFEAHKTDAAFDPAHLRRIGVLAIGWEGTADLAVARIALI